jgi:hypothetical protein
MGVSFRLKAKSPRENRGIIVIGGNYASIRCDDLCAFSCLFIRSEFRFSRHQAEITSEGKTLEKTSHLLEIVTL